MRKYVMQIIMSNDIMRKINMRNDIIHNEIMKIDIMRNYMRNDNMQTL